MKGWINVDDKLPDINTHVIVYMARKGFSPSNICTCEYTRYGFERASVTHWMPLPEYPEVNHE